MSAELSQKLPFQRSLNQVAERRAHDVLQLTGKALPASVVSVAGSIVTVKFEIQSSTITLDNVTVPIAGPEWVRYPTQAKDKGFVVPCDYFLGGMSGLGSGVAGLNLQANLSSLVFFPVGNKNWSATDDPQKIVLYGPSGAVIRTKDSATKIDVSAGGVSNTMAVGSNFFIHNLPVTPGPSGSLWNNGGTVKVVP